VRTHLGLRAQNTHKCTRCHTHVQVDKFEQEVDDESSDTTDFSVLVTGLPGDSGVHEVHRYFLFDSLMLLHLNFAPGDFGIQSH